MIQEKLVDYMGKGSGEDRPSSIISLSKLSPVLQRLEQLCRDVERSGEELEDGLEGEQTNRAEAVMEIKGEFVKWEKIYGDTFSQPSSYSHVKRMMELAIKSLESTGEYVKSIEKSYGVLGKFFDEIEATFDPLALQMEATTKELELHRQKRGLDRKLAALAGGGTLEEDVPE